MPFDTESLTVREASELLRRGDVSAVSLAEECLLKIKEKNPETNAFLEVYDDVIAQAEAADRKIKSGNGVGALSGIPVALKDNILVKGRVATAGSKILGGYVAPYDSAVAEKLKAAGAVLVGRTNMDEFAMGSSTENSAYGPAKNPRDLSKVPGGSSGGSAAAVAMGGALASLGSDTGGSIRQPAAFCGVVGLKPTYGSVSRRGLIAMGSSLDVIGPLGKTVGDAEALFGVIAGKDEMDATSVDSGDIKVPDFKDKEKPVVGVPRRFFEEGLEKPALRSFNEGLSKLESLGCVIKEIELPHAHYSLAAYYILMPAEASTNLARFDGMRFGPRESGENLLEDYRFSRSAGFGREVKRRILLGAYVLSAGYRDAYYGKAEAVRSLISGDFEKAFGEVDIIATPTTPSPAFGLGEKTDPLSMYLADIFTTPANISGIPAISVPFGSSGGLPLGFQIMAPKLGEKMLFEAGRKLLE